MKYFVFCFIFVCLSCIPNDRVESRIEVEKSLIKNSNTPLVQIYAWHDSHIVHEYFIMEYPNRSEFWSLSVGHVPVLNDSIVQIYVDKSKTILKKHIEFCNE